MKNNEIKYFEYCRKSTDETDRQVLSLASQDEEAKRKFGNLSTIKLPHESVSAFEPYKRPVFTDMIERIMKGEAQGIIAWHPDRLARNPIDAAQIIYLLDIGKLKDLKFCNYYFDNSPEGKMMLQITLSQSKYSSDKLSKDVKRGIDKKAAMGWRPGRAPLGYLNSKTKFKGEQDIANDPDRFPLVKQLLNTMLTGNYTGPEIRKYANDELGLTVPATKKNPEHKLHLSETYRILTNPFYYGWYQWNGEWKRGNHEAMITEEEYDRIQFLLGRKGRPRPKTHKFAFTGIMQCGSCGGSVTAEERFKKQKNGNVHHYILYHCTKKINPKCTERQLEIAEFNRQFDEVLAGITVSEKFKHWAIKYVHELRTEEAKSHEASLEAQQKSLLKVTKDLDQLVLKFSSSENANGELLSTEEYQTLKNKLLKDRAALETDLNKQGVAIEEWVELAERTFNFARYARVWFAKGDLETKRAIFACVGSTHLLKLKEVLVTLQKPFKRIEQDLVSGEQELEWFEPLKAPVNTMSAKEMRKEFPVMSG